MFGPVYSISITLHFQNHHYYYQKMQQNKINSNMERPCPKKMAFKCNTNLFHWLRNLNPCVHVTLTSVD